MQIPSVTNAGVNFNALTASPGSNSSVIISGTAYPSPYKYNNYGNNFFNVGCTEAFIDFIGDKLSFYISKFECLYGTVVGQLMPDIAETIPASLTHWPLAVLIRKGNKLFLCPSGTFGNTRFGFTEYSFNSNTKEVILAKMGAKTDGSL